MTAAVEVANAYIALYTKMPGVKKDIEQSLGGSGAAESAGQLVGNKFSSTVGGVIKGGLIAAGVVGAAALGTALVKGFNRLEALDQATAKLEGLGHSAASVDQIMSDALSAVRGTAFGMDEAATAAAGAVAAGVAPGADLARNLKLVADAATIAGTDMGSMGAIFNKVAASNKVQMDVINQLHDAGVPALALLADQMGVTAEEASKMASAGQIDFATFQAAMENGLGGAALSSGNTFKGAMANVMASLGRIGAGLLGGIFPYLAPLMQAITTALSPLEDSAASIGDAIGKFIGPALQWLTDTLNGGFDLGGFFELLGMLSPIGLAFKVLEPILPVLMDAFMQIGGVLSGALSGALAAVLPVITSLAEVLAGTLAEILPVLIPIISQLAGIFGQVLAAVLPLVGQLAGALMPVFMAIAPIIAALLPIFTQIIGLVMPIVEALLPVLTTLIAALAPIVILLVDAFLQLLTPILGILTPLLDLVGVIIPPLVQLLGFLAQLVVGQLSAALNFLIPIIVGVANSISSWLIPIIDTVVAVMGGLITFLTGVFTGNWDQAWAGVKQIFEGAFNGIQDIAKGALNSVIDLINGVIGGINGLAGGLSDLTGGAINLSLGTIPKLAEGGIVRARPGGIIANIGEGRYDEAVIPLPPGGIGALGGSRIDVTQHITMPRDDPAYVQRTAARGLREQLVSVAGAGV